MDAERERYFDLYDLAPAGYCTIFEMENGIGLYFSKMIIERNMNRSITAKNI